MSDSNMSPETLEALRGSIRKWERIVAGTGSENGAADCPLCHKFNKWYLKTGRDCDGCPVKIASGLDGCHGTPLDTYEDSNRDEEEKVAAQAELDFLISLLPPGVEA